MLLSRGLLCAYRDETIVTEAITAQAVLALPDTPDEPTGEPPRPVAEGP
jgi:hypothetical protein